MGAEIISSRPLLGVLISNLDGNDINSDDCIVLVPYWGFLYLIQNCQNVWTGLKVLVPYWGFLYLIPDSESKNRCNKVFSSPTGGSYI